MFQFFARKHCREGALNFSPNRQFVGRLLDERPCKITHCTLPPVQDSSFGQCWVANYPVSVHREWSSPSKEGQQISRRRPIFVAKFLSPGAVVKSDRPINRVLWSRGRDYVGQAYSSSTWNQASKTYFRVNGHFRWTQIPSNEITKPDHLVPCCNT